MGKRWPILITVVVLATAACGGAAADGGIASLQEEAAGGDASTTTTAVDPDQAVLDFTECMREHGVDMPDPQIDSAGGGVVFGFGIVGGEGEGDDPDNAELQEMTEAEEACRHFLEGVVQEFDQSDTSEMEDEMLAFSQCMRDHGFDMPDPEFSEDGGVFQIGPGDEEGGVDPSDPEFQAAQEACRAIFGGGGTQTVGGDPGDGPTVVIGGSPGGGSDTGSSSDGG